MDIEAGVIQNAQHCYWLQKSKSVVHFIICGSDFQYTVEYDSHVGTSTGVCNRYKVRPSIKTYQNHQTKISRMEIESDQLDGKIEQIFALTVGNGDYTIELIHPLHSDSVGEFVKREIRTKFCYNQSGTILVQNKNAGVYVLNKFMKDNLLYDLDPS